jgi:hypothetical protein
MSQLADLREIRTVLAAAPALSGTLEPQAVEVSVGLFGHGKHLKGPSGGSDQLGCLRGSK